MGAQVFSVRVVGTPTEHPSCSQIDSVKKMQGLANMADPSALKEQMKKKAEEQVGQNAPGYLKCLFPCCGGPVGTVEKCLCMVPEDQRPNIQKAIDSYKSA